MQRLRKVLLASFLLGLALFSTMRLPMRAFAAEDKTITVNFMDPTGTTKLVPSRQIEEREALFESGVVPSSMFPVIDGYQVQSWVLQDLDKPSYTIKRGKSFSTNRIFLKRNVGDTVEYRAVYDTNPYQYRIQYVTQNNVKNPASNPTFFTVNSKEITFAPPTRKGYLFTGWYTSAAHTTKITGIPAGYTLDSRDQSVSGWDTLKVYSDWVKAKPGIPAITEAKNYSRGNVRIKFNAAQVPNGYAKQVNYILTYADNKSFKNATTVNLKTTRNYKIQDLVQGSTLYIKVKAGLKDSTGEMVYSSYSKATRVTVKNGIKEYTPSATSAKIKTAKAMSNGKVSVTATVSKRLKSYDDKYYLASVDPQKNTVLFTITSVPKSNSLTIKAPLRDSEKGYNLTTQSLAIAVKTTAQKYMVVSNNVKISNITAGAENKEKFPVAKTKKGMQGYTDLNRLGNNNTFYNMIINDMMVGNTPYVYNGKTYYFNALYQSNISQNNMDGIVVTAQLMLRWPGNDMSYLCFGTDKPAVGTNAPYYAFDVLNQKGAEFFEAFFAFLSDNYCSTYCHVDNWIIGNEVNTADKKDISWYYAGNASRDSFMIDYARTFQLLSTFINSRYKNARIYICLDHTWNDRNGDWGAKPFMDLFNVKLHQLDPNMKWNIAFHAYPAVLTMPAVWRDNDDPRYTCNGLLGSDFVSPLNLQVLTNYVKSTFGKNTRIILSEQGFTSATKSNPLAYTDVQAAAMAYTYYKAEFDDMIDAVIFRSYYDDAGELAQGLAFGIMNASGIPKPAYNVFKYMDTPEYKKYTSSYLKTIGAGSWDVIIPNFKSSKLMKMPKRK